MITTRTPLRITFGGGGSDLAPGGLCVSATIDKFITVTVSTNFDARYVLHYSQSENVEHAEDIQHRLLRRVLVDTATPPGIQVATAADIPAGTGLGSSGAFTVGLLKALYPEASKPALARMACRMDIGQQDQWSAVYGGVNAYDFESGMLRPIETTVDSYLELHYTGLRHDAAAVVTGQSVTRRAALDQVSTAVQALEANDPAWLGECFLTQWAAKLDRAPTPTHQQIDRLIRDGIGQGAYGGKLVGAGDGGFLLFSTPVPLELGLRKVPFQFHHDGVRCM